MDLENRALNVIDHSRSTQFTMNLGDRASHIPASSFSNLFVYFRVSVMHRILCFSVTFLWLVNSCIISAVPINRPESIYHPQNGKNGAITAAEPYATEAGLEVLKRGGNAVDAAVTVGFCLAVTLPSAGNIGGGGFLVYFDSETGKSHALDYRESAPAEAYRPNPRTCYPGPARGAHQILKADPHLFLPGWR